MGSGFGCFFGFVPGFGLIRARVNTEEPIYLVLGHRPVAGTCRHHEITHQLNLGLEVIIREVATLTFGCRHGPNLRADGPRLQQLPTKACRGVLQQTASAA